MTFELLNPQKAFLVPNSTVRAEVEAYRANAMMEWHEAMERWEASQQQPQA